jgi:hypothetical protein
VGVIQKSTYLYYSIPSDKKLYELGGFNVAKKIEKEKLMEFVSRAFDMDAKFEIMFYSDLNTEESAKKLADEFAELVGDKTEEIYSNDLKSRWFKVYGKHSVTVWHHNSHDQKYFKMLSGKEEISNEQIS